MFGLGDDWLLERFLFLLPLILSVTVHEWAHAWSAWRLGDDTAHRQGRVTLDPLQHIDPLGTFLLPLLGVPFGWAKPVPINPGGFRRDVGLRSGLLLTAAAGPAANVCLALVAASAMGLAARVHPAWIVGPNGYRALLEQFIFLNVLLASFNLLPIPPLDGSRIVDCFVPDKWRSGWDRAATLSPLLLGAALILPLFVGVQLYEAPLMWTSQLTAFVLP